jgi:hypothetical protein
VFTNQVFTQADVMGANSTIDETKCDAVLAATVRELILAINHGNSTQAELDRYAFAYFCSCTRHPFLETCAWQQLLLEKPDVFDRHCCVDIGYCIRSILFKCSQPDILTRVIQSSLPYLKHNRLNFPPFDSCTYAAMQDITRIVFGCCLGVFDPDGKKPPWSTRVYLLVFMHELLSRGSKRDLYVFSTAHMALVRIAMIEYFLCFLETNMPIELEYMPLMFSVDATVASMHIADLRQVCNNFRTISFDSGELKLSDLNAKAALMLERCNRICNQKIRIPARAVDATVVLPLVHKAMCAPWSVDCITELLHPELDATQLLALKRIQRIVTRDAFVCEMQALQTASLRSLCTESTLMATKSLFCYVCLGCIDAFTQLDRKMRLHDGEHVHCQTCNSHEHVVRINCLHAIVSIKDTKYFWCPFCRVVHKWSASGFEMHRCDVQPEVCTQSKRACFVCRKNMNVETFTLLDRRLGVMQTASLCFKHRPWPHQMPYVYDIVSFRDAVVAKNLNKVIY